MLDIKDLSITFNKGTINEKKALDHISLHLSEGDFVSVIGSNGAGKSTLLNCISGACECDTGTISLDAISIQFMKEYKRSKLIGRVFQDPLKGSAPDLSIEENLGLSYQRGNKHQTLLSKLFKTGFTKQEKNYMKENLKSLDLGLENRLQSKVGLLSGGQRQALTLMMATINKPKLLLLDEHTAALDPKTAKQVMTITNEIIEQHKITTLMITHNIKHALDYGNQMIVMSNGKIIRSFTAEEKKQLSVQDVMNIYQKASRHDFSDSMLLD